MADVVLIEQETGAQVLPPPGGPRRWFADDRQKASTWQVICALSADLRSKSKPHRDLAAGMIVTVKEARP